MGISSAIEELARQAGHAVADLLGRLLTWWLSPASGINVETPVMGRLHQLTLPLIALILVVSVLVQAGRMMLSRRKEPAIDIALGLIRYALVTGLGLTLIRIGVDLGDALSQMLLQESLPQFTDRIRGVVTSEAMSQPFMLLMQSLVLFVLSLIQWVLLFFRQAGVLVLAAMLPLAASGAINGATRGWLAKIVPWLIGLVAYKPIAAFIYAIGLSFIGQADDFTTIMAGILIIGLAIFALPVMMKFFSWTGVSVTGGASTGSLMAGAATGAASISAMRSARSMEMSGPGSAGSGSAAPASAPPTAAPHQLPSGRGGGGGTSGGGPPGGSSGGGSGGSSCGGSGGAGGGPAPATSGGSAAASPSAGAGGAGGAAAGSGAAAAAGGPAAAAAAGAEHAARTARSVAEQATSPPDSGPSAGPNAGPSAGPSGSGGSRGSGPSGSGPRR